MGFKKTNYEVKKLGITLPEAYANIRNLKIDGENGYAEIVVQSTREATGKLAPLETVRVDFKVNSNENPFVTAYNTAKGQKTVKMFNTETHQVEDKVVNMPFYDWTDDIQ
jgi:hypothetical protein